MRYSGKMFEVGDHFVIIFPRALWIGQILRDNPAYWDVRTRLGINLDRVTKYGFFHRRMIPIPKEAIGFYELFAY